MIRLEISAAVALYLFFYVIIILALWILSRDKRVNKKYVSDDKHIWHCSICDYTYVDSRHEGISQCPRCESYVEKSKEDTAYGTK